MFDLFLLLLIPFGYSLYHLFGNKSTNPLLLIQNSPLPKEINISKYEPLLLVSE